MLPGSLYHLVRRDSGRLVNEAFALISIMLIKLISKFMSLKSVQETAIIHILLKISRGENNQAIKSNQLIGYNQINIFL